MGNDSAGGQRSSMMSKSGAKSEADLQKQLKQKDLEILKLQNQLREQQAKQAGSNNKDLEKDILRKKVKELEQENRNLRTRLSNANKGSQSGTRAPVSAAKTRPKTSSGPSVASADKGNAPIGKTQNRVLTLRQLKDTITDMYAQKVKFDKKCVDNKVSKETLE